MAIDGSTQLAMPIRLRDRLLPVLTVTIAAALVVGAERAADYVGSMNSARVLGAWLSGMHRQSQPTTGVSADTPAPPSPDQLKSQVATVEVVIVVWRWAMRVTGGLLWLAAVVGACRRSPRGSQLLAAGLLLISTGLTLASLVILTRPDWGGMEPLSPLTYVLVGGVQSLYAWVLLIAFARAPHTTVRLETAAPLQ